MHITHLHLIRFGRLEQVRLGPLPQGMVLLHGPNEAGKSTLLRFIRFMLFGNPAEVIWPPDGSAVHGRMTLTSTDGKEVHLERSQSAGKGRSANALFACTDAQGRPLPWESLTGNASAAFFSSVYALSLAELNQVGFMTEQEFQEKLISAGMGLGGVSLAATEQQLITTGEKLYLPGGRKQHLVLLQKELQERQAEIRQLQEQLPTYERLRQSLHQLGAALDESRAEYGQLIAEQTRLTTYRNLSEPFYRWQQAHEELTRLSPPTLPGLPALQQQAARHQAELARLQQEADGLRTRLKSLQTELDEAGPQQAVWAEEETAIRRLAARQETFALQEERLATLRAESGQLREQAAHTLQWLGHGWTEADVRSAAGLAQQKATLSHLHREAEAARQSQQTAGQVSALRQEAHAKAEAEALTARQKAQSLGKNLSFQQEEALFERIAALEELKDRLRVPPSPASNSGLRMLPFVAVLLAVLALAALLSQLLAAAFVLLAGAAGTLGFYWWQSAQQTKSTGQADLSALLKKCGFPEGCTFQQAAEELLKVRQQAERLREWKAEADKAADLAEKAEATRLQWQQADQQARQAAQHTQQAMQALENWLAAQRLPGNAADIAIASEALRRIEILQADLRQRDRAEAEQERIQQEIGSFHAERSRLETRLKAAHAASEGSTPTQWLQTLEKVQQASRQRDLSEGKIQQTKKDLAHCLRQQENVQAEISALLAQAGAADLPSLSRMAEAAQHYTALEERTRQLLRNLHEIAGPAETPAALDYLRQHGRSELEARLLAVAEELERVQAHRESLLREEQQLTDRLRELEKQGQQDSLLMKGTEAENLKAQLKEGLTDWLAVKMALHLLRQTRQLYEEEKQPAVMKIASDLLARITAEPETGGGYLKVVLPPEPKAELFCIGADGSRKPLAALSTGTREQLLLCLRLAFIATYEQSHPALPLVLDDVLVNYDERRAARTAHLLADFARTRQLWLFTCHERTRQMVAPEAHVIGL